MKHKKTKPRGKPGTPIPCDKPDKKLRIVTVNGITYELRVHYEGYIGKDGKPAVFGMTYAFTPSGLFIGTPRMARHLAKHGIIAEKRDASGTCSIGFCHKDRRWYGWSHRAMCGFGIGDKVFEEHFGDDNTPYRKHGSKPITTLEEARTAAALFAGYVS